jgi:7-cyano-7-deazaguanine synthase
VPVTYVPARNTIFLSLALGWAEAAGASDLFIGVNALDYSGYPIAGPNSSPPSSGSPGSAPRRGARDSRSPSTRRSST